MVNRFQLLAVWIMHEHSNSGKENLQLVELGPGRGTLMKDIVRVSLLEFFWKLTEIFIVLLGVEKTEIFRCHYVICLV